MFHRHYHEYTTPRAVTSRTYSYAIHSISIPHNHCSCYLFYYHRESSLDHLLD
jgi:hypothetical protein